MLSDQMNGTYRRNVRLGLGTSALGGKVQQGLFSRGAAPPVAAANASRGINYAAARPAGPAGAVGSGSGFGVPVNHLAPMEPGVGQAPGMGAPINPGLAMLGQLLLAQAAQRGGAR